MSKTKELVAAGHALAKELHCADSAALVRELATQLDVQLVRGNQLEQQLAAVEHSGGRMDWRGAMEDAIDLINTVDEVYAVTPATDAFLAEVRAQGVEMYADNLDSGADDAERDGFDDAVKFLRSEASGVRLFAAQLRQGAEHE